MITLIYQSFAIEAFIEKITFIKSLKALTYIVLFLQFTSVNIRLLVSRCICYDVHTMIKCLLFYKHSDYVFSHTYLVFSIVNLYNYPVLLHLPAFHKIFSLNIHHSKIHEFHDFQCGNQVISSDFSCLIISESSGTNLKFSFQFISFQHHSPKKCDETDETFFGVV